MVLNVYFFLSENFMQIMEKDAEDRRIKRVAKVKKATGMQAVTAFLSLWTFLILALYHCSAQRQGKWSLCSRGLRNCCQVLQWRVGWTKGHAASLHQQSTSKQLQHWLYILWLWYLCPKIKTNKQTKIDNYKIV